MRKKSKKMGAPNKRKRDLKKSRSIRATDACIKTLIKRYGTLQKAFDTMIANDEGIWS